MEPVLFVEEIIYDDAESSVPHAPTAPSWGASLRILSVSLGAVMIAAWLALSLRTIPQETPSLTSPLASPSLASRSAPPHFLDSHSEDPSAVEVPNCLPEETTLVFFANGANARFHWRKYECAAVKTPANFKKLHITTCEEALGLGLVPCSFCYKKGLAPMAHK